MRDQLQLALYSMVPTSHGMVPALYGMVPALYGMVPALYGMVLCEITYSCVYLK